MAKGTVEKRPLTEEELADAKRLKDAWLLYKAEHKVTQDWLSEQTKLGNQTLMAQYLNGQIQLNPKAVLAFSSILNVPPSSISPSMKFPSLELTAMEEELLQAFRVLDDEQKMIILRTAQRFAKVSPSEQGSVEVLRKHEKPLQMHKK